MLWFWYRKLTRTRDDALMGICEDSVCGVAVQIEEINRSERLIGMFVIRVAARSVQSSVSDRLRKMDDALLGSTIHREVDVLRRSRTTPRVNRQAAGDCVSNSFPFEEPAERPKHFIELHAAEDTSAKLAGLMQFAGV